MGLGPLFTSPLLSPTTLVSAFFLGFAAFVEAISDAEFGDEARVGHVVVELLAGFLAGLGARLVDRHDIALDQLLLDFLDEGQLLLDDRVWAQGENVTVRAGRKSAVFR